jgi:hypothetical protein
MAEALVYEPVHYADDDELPHRPGPDPWWQESVFLHWYDAGNRVGGIHRIGHEPGQGIVALSCAVFGPGVRFRRNGTAPLPEVGNGAGFGAGGHRFWFDGANHLQVDEPGCRLDLTVADFYPRTDFFPSNKKSSLTEEFAAHHFEASGRVTGTATLGERTFEIDAFCHRDHSWGIRKWDTLVNHRWISGSLSPELSFGSVVWQSKDGALVRGGYVVRKGEVHYADDLEVVTYLDVDGLTHQGGEVVWHFGEEELRLRCAPVDGVLFVHHDVAWVDILCEVEHDGMTGVCDFEISTNPRQGNGPILASLNANVVEGLSTW